MEKATGIVILYNTLKYPFNDSLSTIALPSPAINTDYLVTTTIIASTGEVGDIFVSGKARNGFKMAFTGSASQATILWKVEVL